MELNKIKKLKSSLETILDKMEQEAKEQGTGVNSPGFQEKLANIKKSMLQRFGVDESVYELIDDLIERQRRRISDNFLKKKEKDIKSGILGQKVAMTVVKNRLD